MPTTRADVVILGAGIAGTALAYHLAERHAGSVVLCDPATPAAGATGRAAGIVTEQLWERWDVDVVRESRTEYAELARRWDRSAYDENGFVRWTRRPEVAHALATAERRLIGWGVSVERLTPSQVSDRLPSVSSEGICAAAACWSDGVVTPSAIAEIYAEGARRAGVDVWLGAPSPTLTADPAGGWSIMAGERVVRTHRAVVAAGAWSKRLLAAAGHPLPLCPYRTQAAILRPGKTGPDRIPSAHDLDVDVYVRPEANGRILAGDGTEHVEADPLTFRASADEAFVEHLAETFQERFPGWQDAELVRAWAGVCTATPDRRPLIGRVPSAQGLYCLVGFNGFGVMRAGGAARRLADALVRGDDDPPLLRSVAPARFRGPPTPFVPRPGFTLEGGDDPRF